MLNPTIFPLDAFDKDDTPNPKTEENKNHQHNLELKQAHRKERKNRKAKAILRRNERLSKSQPPPNYFIGKHKWLGGAMDPDSGIIYGVPSNSIEIICIHPPNRAMDDTATEDDARTYSNGTARISTIPLPNIYKEGSFKWLRGIITNGHLYGIPAWSTNGVLKVRLNKHGKGPRVCVLSLPNKPQSPPAQPQQQKSNQRPKRDRNHVNPSSAVRRDLWMWHGAGLSDLSFDPSSNICTSTPAIYCIPSNAERVLKINVLSDQVTEIGPTFSQGQNKWYGGIRGIDGCIYGIPYTATGVLRIDPRTDTVQLLGDFPLGGWKWHGGLLSPVDGIIYAFPAHSNEVLCIDTNHYHDPNDPTNHQNWRISTIPIHKHANDHDPDDLRYKWLGGAYGADGCIYGMPSDATSILRIDPNISSNHLHHSIHNHDTDTPPPPKTKKTAAIATTFGNVALSDTPLNKWQGGVLSSNDHCVYAVPANANCVLKIDTHPDTPLTIEFLDCQLHHAHSWSSSSSAASSKENHHDQVEDKWQGGFMGKDGIIYGIPECVDRVMKLVPGKDARVEYI